MPGSTRGTITRYPEDDAFPGGESGAALTVDFTLGDVPYQLLNGGQQFSLSRLDGAHHRRGRVEAGAEPRALARETAAPTARIVRDTGSRRGRLKASRRVQWSAATVSSRSKLG